MCAVWVCLDRTKTPLFTLYLILSVSRRSTASSFGSSTTLIPRSFSPSVTVSDPFFYAPSLFASKIYTIHRASSLGSPLCKWFPLVFWVIFFPEQDNKSLRAGLTRQLRWFYWNFTLLFYQRGSFFLVRITRTEAFEPHSIVDQHHTFFFVVCSTFPFSTLVVV